MSDNQIKILDKLNIAIIGASGYTGNELIRLAYYHPYINIKYLVAESNAGKDIGDVYPHLKLYDLPKLISLGELNWNEIDVVFCCLPHSTSQEIIREIPNNKKIIDLSADFRLNDIEIY